MLVEIDPLRGGGGGGGGGYPPALAISTNIPCFKIGTLLAVLKLLRGWFVPFWQHRQHIYRTLGIISTPRL